MKEPSANRTQAAADLRMAAHKYGANAKLTALDNFDSVGVRVNRELLRAARIYARAADRADKAEAKRKTVLR